MLEIRMRVPSTSSKWRDVEPYLVESHDRGSWWSCTCPHWQNRLARSKARCKHIDFVIAFEKKQAAEQAAIASLFEYGWGFDWEDPPKPDLHLDEESA